jgi:hypothetical protein
MCKRYLHFNDENTETYKQFRIHIKEQLKALQIKSRRQAGDMLWGTLQTLLHTWLFKHGVFGGYLINIPSGYGFDDETEEAKKAVYDLSLDVLKAVNHAEREEDFMAEVNRGKKKFARWDKKLAAIRSSKGKKTALAEIGELRNHIHLAPTKIYLMSVSYSTYTRACTYKVGQNLCV